MQSQSGGPTRIVGTNGLILENGSDVVMATFTPTLTTLPNEANIGGVSADGAGKAVCIKADGNLGTCSDAVGGAGTCTCA